MESPPALEPMLNTLDRGFVVEETRVALGRSVDSALHNVLDELAQTGSTPNDEAVDRIVEMLVSSPDTQSLHFF